MGSAAFTTRHRPTETATRTRHLQYEAMACRSEEVTWSCATQRTSLRARVFVRRRGRDGQRECRQDSDAQRQ